MASENSSSRVLFVDDCRLTRQVVMDALGERLELECVESAEAAIAALERKPADLVLSDLKMEGLSGLDLLAPGATDHARRAVRAADRTRLGRHRDPGAARWRHRLPAEARAAGADRLGGRARALTPAAAARQRAPARLGPHARVVPDADALPRSRRGLRGRARSAAARARPRPRAGAVPAQLDAGLRRHRVPRLRRGGRDRAPAARGAGQARQRNVRAARAACTTRGGPIGEALDELGVGAGPALLVPLHGVEKEEGVLWVPERVARLPRRTSSRRG